MKTKTRKITSLLFILLGFIPLLFTLVLTLKKNDVRKRMKHELEYRELQTIVIPEDKVIWMEDHEIWVNESMFDIHTRKLEDGIYTFTGLFDEEETLLMEQEKNATGKNNVQNKLLVHLFKILPVSWFIQEEPGYKGILQTTYYPAKPGATVHPYREISTPPPRILY